MRTGIYYGIDFGTTNTAAVQIIVDEHGTRIVNLAEEGEQPFASIVAIPKDGSQKMLFGRDVKRRRQELSTDYTIVPSIKSFLNDNEEIVAGGKRYSATEVTANFLLFVKEHIKAKYSITIDEATFAFPVDFKPRGRTELIKAATAANIKVKGFVSESTAAYIANKNQSKAISRVMVVDWGGGTLDISILDLKEGQLYETAVLGEKIGGDDIDLLLAQKFHSRLVMQTGIQTGYEEMADKDKDTMIAMCEQTKINLSNDEEEAGITLRNYGRFGTKNITITYEYFCDVITPIIKNIIRVIDTAMRQAATTKSGIDAVILVGGSCGLRSFCNIISSLFGNDKIVIPEKMQWSVAGGAALISVTDSDYRLNDDVGIILSDKDNTVFPILERNVAKVGTNIQPITFALTEDSPDAHFLFTNGDKSINYGIVNVHTKGFMSEHLELTASINIDQIAKFVIRNKNMGSDYKVEHYINKLKFSYDLSQMGDF